MGVSMWVKFLVAYASYCHINFRDVQQAMFEKIKAEKEDGRGLDMSDSQSSEAAARTSGKNVKEKMDEDAVKQRLTTLSERLCRLNAYSSRLNFNSYVSHLALCVSRRSTRPHLLRSSHYDTLVVFVCCLVQCLCYKSHALF